MTKTRRKDKDKYKDKINQKSHLYFVSSGSKPCLCKLLNAADHSLPETTLLPVVVEVIIIMMMLNIIIITDTVKTYAIV